MNIENKDEFLISMILDDLIHTKPVMGLMQLNLTAECYHLNISDKVISLMGFTDVTENERVFNYYIGMLARSKDISLGNGNKEMENLAKEIYRELELQKATKLPTVSLPQ